ncbi:MAG: hypothetical protein BAJALOKI1v1_2300005 [Promethearchaeota archaeon]|nr:MAG: hypothetical protein BAJALOKI1v1_2300005 [Candidatus Lokiarchaeota archaeon]
MDMRMRYMESFGKKIDEKQRIQIHDTIGCARFIFNQM